MSQLIVQNFGAIKNATIDIRKYNFYIGHTSSGKSTVAKLLTIFNNASFWILKEGHFEGFCKLLEKYNINFEFSSDTLIKYTNDKYHWEISLNKFHTNYKDSDLLEMAKTSDSYDFILKFIEKKEGEASFVELIKSLKDFVQNSNIIKNDSSFKDFIKSLLIESIYEACIPVYIPAERLLITTFSNSIFSLLKAGASIPDCIKDFGSLYEKARSQYKNIDIDILNIKVSFDNQGDKVYLVNENKELQLSQTSSGIQSIIPLWTVFNQYAERNKKQMLVIEEPELNLFPITQHLLVDWLMSKMRKNKEGSIVITTHSPYVLSVIDNLILAQEIILKGKNRSIYAQIKQLIPSMGLIKFDDVSSYFFNADGTVSDIRDEELKSTGAEHLDDASNDLGQIFNELCRIYNEL